MINLLNYETFFLLYADGELSSSEQESVLQFVEQHPMLKEEFNRIKAIQFSPEKGLVMMDKSALRMEIPEEFEADCSFEPDLSIVYSNKAELYRKENVLPVYWLRMVAVAAAIFFTMGIAWMVIGEKDNNSSFAMETGAAEGSSSVKEPALPISKAISPLSEDKMPTSRGILHHQVNRAVASSATASTVTSMKATEVKNRAGQTSIDLQQSIAIVTPQVVVSDVSALSTSQQVSVQQKGNFSETVLLAAAERMATTAASMPSEPNTTMLINAAMKEEKKSGLRSIIRTISRRLLDEHEPPQDQKFIQVANFYIPVNK